MRINVYLPEKTLTNDEMAQIFPDWSAKKIESKLGVRSRRHSAPDETALDMAERVCIPLLTEEDRGKVDFLLLCTQSPDYYLPTSACLLQERLGLRTTIGALDYNLGCSGFVYGLALAKGLLAGGLANRVLLVMSETYTKHIHPRDKGNLSIFGDGAAAAIIDRSDLPGLHEFALGTDGRGAENLIIPNGGLRHRYDPAAADWEDDNGSLRNDNNLYMNGPEIFNFTIEAVPALIRQVLEKNRISLEEIDYVILHQANRYMLQYLRDLIQVPEDKFYLNMTETGNTVSATIPIALKDARESGLIKPGDKVLLAGFGVGYSYAATMITIQE